MLIRNAKQIKVRNTKQTKVLQPRHHFLPTSPYPKFFAIYLKAPTNSQIFDYSFMNLLFDEENGSQIFGGEASRAADSRSTPCALCPVLSSHAQQHSHVGSSSKQERIRNSCRRVKARHASKRSLMFLQIAGSVHLSGQLYHYFLQSHSIA